MSHPTEWVHLEVKWIKKETKAAFLCIITKADDVDLDKWEEWIPKSQISDVDDYSEDDKNITMSVTEWISDQIGFFK